MTDKDSAIATVVKKTAFLPPAIRTRVVSTLFGKAVPMVGTAGIKYDVVTPEKVEVSLANRRPMQNHIKSLHAVAMALLAETATGFVVGMNLPADKLPLIKTLQMDYKKLSKGDMRAVATLTPGQIEQIKTQPKGEVTVPCTITDATGGEPVKATMVWAWIPKKREEKPVSA